MTRNGRSPSLPGLGDIAEGADIIVVRILREPLASNWKRAKRGPRLGGAELQRAAVDPEVLPGPLGDDLQALRAVVGARLRGDLVVGEVDGDRVVAAQELLGQHLEAAGGALSEVAGEILRLRG